MKKDLKHIIEKFKHEIDMIKEMFDKMINILDTYYTLNKNMLRNYDRNKRNYYKLKNLNNLKNSNDILIKELYKIINTDNLSTIYDFSFNNFYSINGERYLGEMKNGLKDGKGILFYNKDNNSRKKYVGEFKKDVINGKGKMI